jgi:hypothetical protein
MKDDQGYDIFEDRIQKISYGFLGAWVCAPLDVSDEDLCQLAKKYGVPVTDDALIIDRWYGGFRCDNPQKRHFYIALSQYTYLGQNRQLDEADRLDTWNKLLQNNPPGNRGFIGGGPCCHDAPV